MSKPMKILVGICGALCLILALLAIALPKIVSSKQGTNFILGAVNESINGKVSAKKISVQWFGGQLIEGVTLEDPSGETVATLELMSTSQPLWDILLNGWTISQSRLEELNASIVQYSNGSTNLQLALSQSPSDHNGKSNHETSRILAKHVNGMIHVSDDMQNVTSHFEGKTQQGKLDGEFSLDVTLFQGDSRALSGVDDLNLSLDIKNFPVAFIDSIASIKNPQFNGLISALMGESLNATITEKQNGTTATTHWAVATPNFQLKLDGNLDVNNFSLSSPAEAQLRVTPDLLAKLEENRLLASSLRLKDSADVKIVLNTLTFPFQVRSKKDIGVDLEFDVSELEVIGDTLSKNLVIEEISGAVKAPLDGNQAKIHFIGKAGDKGEDSFKVTVDATIEKPEDLDHLLDDLKRKAEINLEARGVPTVLFDTLIGGGSSLKDIIGRHIQLDLDGKLDNGHGFFSLSAKSDNINLDNANFTLNNNVELQKPVKLNFILTPEAFQQLYPSELTLRDPAHFQLVVDQFSLPLAENSSDTPLRMNAKLIAMGEVLLDSKQGGRFSLENSSIKLVGSSLDAIQIGLATGVITHEDSGMSWELLGASTQVNLSAKFSVSPSRQLRLTEANAHVEGSTIKLAINGDVRNGEFTLSAPATISYVMTPSILESLFPTLNGVKHIEEDVPVVLTIATQKPSMKLGSLQDVELSGHLSVPVLPFKFGNQKITLRDIMIPWEFDGYQKRAKLSMSGASYLPGSSNKGTFKGKLTLKDWHGDSIIDTANYKLRLDLINFPAETFNVVDNSEAIPTLIGKTIQAEVDAEFDGINADSYCDVVIEGEDFDLRAALEVNQQISLKKASDPITISMKLTPERFAIISKILRPNPKNPLELVGNSSFKLSLDHLNVPVAKTEHSVPLWNAGIKGSLHLDKMLIFDKRRNRQLPFDEVNVFVDTEDLASSLSFDLSTVSNTGETGAGSLSIQGTVRNAFKESGELNLEALSLDAGVFAKNLQTEAFCQLFCPYPTMADKVQALIGDPINTDLDIHIMKMDGPIKGTLQGTNGHASLNAYVRNGYLTLNDPFIAQVKATPELGKAIMREIAPFLSGLQESSEPITLRLDPKGFSFPITNFDRKNISIGLCSLNMGRMLFTNSGQMQAVLGLLGSSASNTIPIWVTPLYVRMHEGKIKLERVDMLLNNRFPIAAWGGVDVVKEKVNMVIGITGYALATAMNIQNISSDYMLQVPLKGPLGNPKLDKKKAAAKISALVAQEHGTQGMVIGTVLDIATGGLTESAPPSPTTQPLPWAGQLSERQEPSQATKANEQSLIDTSKEKVQKGAEKLFKRIFK